MRPFLAFAAPLILSLFAQTASAQTATSGSALTRNLNSAPPVGARPATAAPPASIATPALEATPAPASARPAAAVVSPPAVDRLVSTPTRAPAPATGAPIAVPPPAPVGPPPPAPNVPTVTVLDAAARAALPFTLDLPPGFELVTGRPGPDFKIYTVRRGQKSFAMIYAGPSSQFPIYTGDTVQAAGRTSIVVNEDGQRRAVEHLFERIDAPAGSPKEVHVWTMSLEGQDRALAERIAQSVDRR